VAATLVRAWGPAAGDVWAAGARPPLYHHDGKSWFAVPGSAGLSGAVVLAEPGSPVPAIAVGRRVLVVQDRRLVIVPAAPGPVTALWVTTPKDAVAVVGGKVQRLGAGGWRPVAGADEAIVALGPRVALGLDGGVYLLVDKLRKVPGIEGFRPRLVAAGKRVVLVGAQGDGWSAATLSNARLVALGPLPGVERADEPVGLVAGEPILVVTRGGRVLTGDGATWTAARVELGAPTETARPGPGPATIPAPPASR
jgi:hypothetical protein